MRLFLVGCRGRESFCLVLLTRSGLEMFLNGEYNYVRLVENISVVNLLRDHRWSSLYMMWSTSWYVPARPAIMLRQTFDIFSLWVQFLFLNQVQRLSTLLSSLLL